MKNIRTTWLVMAILVLACSLYRTWDSRPMGFAPQIAMALFAGSVLSNKKWALIVPLISMLISDALYQFLYVNGLSSIKGFYSGQALNYLFFSVITLVGFVINKNRALSIATGAVGGATLFFILSNASVWAGGGLDILNQPYPKTVDGLIRCFTEALPFYRNSLWATLLFSGIFFGLYHMYSLYEAKRAHTAI